MPNQQVFNLHPVDWESDPPTESFKLSTLDYCVAQVYNNFALFFSITDNIKPDAARILKRGLEITLSQCRQLCGRLELHPDGGLCFHKTRDSTVEFHLQWLDGPDDDYPSLQDLEKQHFASRTLGNLETWCVPPMTYGEKPAAQPASKPVVAAFKATFIRGGMVFVMHHHHYANDVMGWAGELHQLAENCAALWKNWDAPSLPPWDPACLDLRRLTAPDVPPEQQVDGRVSPERHPDHKQGQWLLFHLPKSKAAELKRVAAPKDRRYWISSYDAYMAYIWRMLSKHRTRLFKPDPKQPLLWGEAVDLRRRLLDPAVPERIQGNVVFAALSTQSPVPPLTVEEVISTAPLEKLAWYNPLSSYLVKTNISIGTSAKSPTASRRRV